MSTAFAAIGCVLLSVMAQFLIKAGLSSVAVKAALARPAAFQTVVTVLLDPE